MYQNKVLLITGGTGSFGQAVLKRFLGTDIGEIRIFSRDEKKQDDLRNRIASGKVSYYLGDVRDFKSVAAAMHGADYVFHAAALKQVPSCEAFPTEAFKTNVLGTENVLDAAITAGASKVVCLSTDKAVYPINAMGISKAMMEKILMMKSRTQYSGGTIICGTRYGNVMASRSSVIPLFISQILGGAPITVTDPTMTRFMMSLDEAVDLVLFAFENGAPGDIFVQKSPSCTVGDLALALKELFHADNPIKIIGARQGEKFYEVLIAREDMPYTTEMKQYFKISANRGNAGRAGDAADLTGGAEHLREYDSLNTRQMTVEEIKEKLLRIDFVTDALAKRSLSLRPGALPP